MADECLIKFLRKTKPGTFFPSTDLYKEGWMLRLILDWFHRNPQPTHAFGFNRKATWYSEALLPSAFLPRFRGDNLAENWTHADGVIGHITIEENTRAGLELRKDASQFIVIEAKIFSGLSKGVKHAPYFNQVARTVACMVEVAKRAKICPSQFEDIAFCVVAPKSQIGKGIFSEFMDKNHIQSTVEQRVSEYQGAQDNWFNDWFSLTFHKTKTDVISWECILDFISEKNAADGKALKAFYEKCLEFNKPAVQNGKPA